jgi:hypothetical protein
MVSRIRRSALSDISAAAQRCESPAVGSLPQPRSALIGE